LLSTGRDERSVASTSNSVVMNAWILCGLCALCSAILAFPQPPPVVMATWRQMGGADEVRQVMVVDASSVQLSFVKRQSGPGLFFRCECFC